MCAALPDGLEMIVTRPDDDASWLEEGSGETAQSQFALPVTLVRVNEDGSLASR